MVPSSFKVDNRVASFALPFEERRVPRRSAPEPLRFDIPSPGMPLLRLAARHPPGPLREAPRGRFARLAALVRLRAPA